MTHWITNSLAAALLCSLTTPLAAQSFTDLHTFTGAGDGAVPLGTPIAVTSHIFATTSTGGASGFGTIYRVTPATGLVRTVYSFADNDGHSPTGGLVYAGGSLYGTTRAGGSNNCGTIWGFNIAAGTLQTLYTFDCQGNGGYPTGQLAYSNGNLYGTTQYGGANGQGAVFVHGIQSYYHTNLHDFAGNTNDGAYPAGGVSLVNNVLYGTASQGGPWNAGSIFRIALTNYNTYTTLHFFSGGTGNPWRVDGANPQAAPVALNGSLYGNTVSGGANNTGAVYKVKIASGELVKLVGFGGYYSNGGAPVGPLLVSHGTVIGVASGSGANGAGTIYSVNPSSAAITDMFDMYQAGYDSVTGLVAFGGSFFGAATQGGYGYPDQGTVFQYTP